MRLDSTKEIYTQSLMFWKIRINHILQWNDKEEALCVFKNTFIFLQAPSLFPLNIIYKTWRFLLRNRHQKFLSRRNPELFLKVMHVKGVPLDNSWGFPDDTERRPCSPEKSLVLLYIIVYCCNKFQPVVVLNGLRKLVWSSWVKTWQWYAGRFWSLKKFSILLGNLGIFWDPGYPQTIYLQSRLIGANTT